MIPRPKRRSHMQQRASVSIDDALRDPMLLGAALGDPSTWRVWLAVLRATFGDRLNASDRAAFDSVAGGRNPPLERASELWAVAGRRSGKSRIAAAVAVFFALLAPASALARGETGHVICISPTRQQARIVFAYALAFIEQSPVLRQHIAQVKAEEIVLRNGIVIGVHSASFRTIRGRTILAAIFDESAFWRDETSATPDVEIYRAVVPALASTNGMLVGISSPYRRIGLLFEKHRDHYGQDGDVLVIQSPSTGLNPTLNPSIIAKARNADPNAALAEWDAQFRNDMSAFLADPEIDAAIDHARPPELLPQEGRQYTAFADASAGRHDHFTLAIGHREQERIIIDALRGAAPPCDPNSVAAEYAGLAKAYRCAEIMGDAFAGEWVAGAFKRAGIGYKRSQRNRSELYLESLPLWNRHAVVIPNHARLIRELRLLERRTHRSGKDSVDHGNGGSDDYANSVCGLMAILAASREPMRFSAHFKRRANEVVRPERPIPVFFQGDPRW